MAHGKKIKKLIINKMTFILLIPKLFLRVSFRDLATEKTMMEMFFYYLITSASENMESIIRKSRELAKFKKVNFFR